MSHATPLPLWATELRERYLAGEASVFLLHGNVRDIYPWQEADGTVSYVPLRGFLERLLCRSKDIVAYFNCSEGIAFPEPRMKKSFLRAVNVRRLLEGTPEINALPEGAADMLPMLEALLTDPTQSAALILDYVETVVPMGELSYMGEADKANLVTLQRWASEPALQKSDNLVLLVSQHRSDVHRRVVSSAQLASVEVALPGLSERRAFVESQKALGAEVDMEEDALAQHSAGLGLVHIRNIFQQGLQSKEPITFRTVALRKKSIIEQECHGLVEFVDPGHDFSHVGGMARIKRQLMGIAKAIRGGHRNRVPMGVIFVGPMGTGKTYIAEAFAGESGLTCIKFKNFREKWVGSTEANLEKVLQVVEALGYVLLIIDEADRSLSSGSDGDGGTNSRVIARLKEFMSDTSHRGQVVILLMTNRPDKLDTDLKRPGRFDLKIPFFFPESPDERRLILEALVRRNEILLVEGADLAPVVSGTKGYSAAELEAVLLAAAGLAGLEDSLEVSQQNLELAVKDVIPSRDTRMLSFMELLAVFEASSRMLLPDHYRDMSAEEVQSKLDTLRLALGRRVV